MTTGATAVVLVRLLEWFMAVTEPEMQRRLVSPVAVFALRPTDTRRRMSLDA